MTMNIYVVAIVILSLIGAGSVLGLTMFRPAEDNASLIATILAFIAPTIASLLAFAVRDIHLSVNSRLDELVSATGREEHAKGVIQGEAQSKAPE